MNQQIATSEQVTMEWRVEKLKDVLQKTSSIDPRKNPEIEFDYIDVSSVSRTTFSIQETTRMKGVEAPSRARRHVKSGDVIFATIRPTLQRVAIVPDNLDEQVCSTGYFILRPKPELYNRFVYYYLFTESFMSEMERRQKGASYPAVNDGDIRDQVICFPPLPEQKRIVAILDEVFAGISQAVANAEKNLANARELFESYLNNVFTQKGDGWVEESMEAACNLITCGVAATPKYVDEDTGVPFLSAQNVKNGEVTLHKFRHISKELHTSLTKKNKPQRGDILYSRVGAGFGDAAVVEHTFDFSVYVSLTLIKPKSEKLNNYFLKYYLNSPVIKSLAKSSITSSGVPNLNVKTVRQFQVSYPSLQKQKVLVNEIDLIRDKVSVLQKIHKKKLSALHELKQSILQKAFTGELIAETSLKAANG